MRGMADNGDRRTYNGHGGKCEEGMDARNGDSAAAHVVRRVGYGVCREN
jgi:hypothetical protein